MRNRSVACAEALTSAFLSLASPGFAGQAECEIPFRLQGHFIVVAASLGNASGLRFMIDTAATGVVVDKKVIKALGMPESLGEARLVTLGQIDKARQFHLPKLRIGPVHAILNMQCTGADLSGLGVDGILGGDFLGQQTWLADCGTDEVVKSGSFTIDLQARRLRFGHQEQLENTAPMEVCTPRMIVLVRIQGHPLRLAVDTGSCSVVLFKESQMGWLQPMAKLQSAGFYMLGGIGRGRQVLLPSMELGNSRWTHLSGILVDLPSSTTDGVLSVAQLGLKMLHFDFKRNLMSWKQ